MQIVEFILHIDKHLASFVGQYGSLSYAILFLIVFCETGLVVTPFLPGDSLLFAVGALSATHILNIWTAYFLFLLAVICGDNVNYWFGRKMGPRVFSKKDSKIFNQSHLHKTEKFYERYGVKTIILARFVPVVRTFAPFVAGVGKMKYSTFLLFSIAGGFAWVSLFTFLGYFFGSIEIIKKNFEFAVIGIILVSLIPIIYEYIKHKTSSTPPKQNEKKVNYKDIKNAVQKED
jgi:membrane-associated protein